MVWYVYTSFFFFFQAEDGIRDLTVTGVQTCALPISGLRIDEADFEDWLAPRREELRALALRVFQQLLAQQLTQGNVQPALETATRSEEHTSELQSQSNLVCRLLLEKKNRQAHCRRAS